MISLTKSLALEYAPHDIRVNVICPGFLWTRAWEGLAQGIKLSVPEYAALEPYQVFLEVVKRGVPLGQRRGPERHRSVDRRRRWHHVAAGAVKAGMTSRAKRVSCSIMRSRGVPSAHAIITCSSPGYRASTSLR